MRNYHLHLVLHLANSAIQSAILRGSKLKAPIWMAGRYNMVKVLPLLTSGIPNPFALCCLGLIFVTHRHRHANDCMLKPSKYHTYVSQGSASAFSTPLALPGRELSGHRCLETDSPDRPYQGRSAQVRIVHR